MDHLEATCADLHSHLADHLAGATAALPMHTLDSLFIDPWRHEELRGIVLATLLLTFLAELFSFRSVRSIMHHNGPTLYLQAVALCVFNTAVLGPLTLAAVTQLRLLRPPRTSPHAYSLEWEWRFKWMAVDANEVVFLVVLHSIGEWVCIMPRRPFPCLPESSPCERAFISPSYWGSRRNNPSARAWCTVRS